MGSENTSIYKSTQVVTRLTHVVDKKDVIQTKYLNDQIHPSYESNHYQYFDLSILNLDDKQIKTFSHHQLQSGYNKIELPLNGLTPGIYFFQMNTKQKLYSGKFVVIKE